MDKDKSGVLDVGDIRQTYNAKLHPDVKADKKTEDDIQNFLIHLKNITHLIMKVQETTTLIWMGGLSITTMSQ